MKKVLVVFPQKFKGKIHPWFRNQIEVIKKAGGRITILNLPENNLLIFKLMGLFIKTLFLLFLIPKNEVIYVPASYLLSLPVLLSKLFTRKVIIAHVLTTAFESERLNLPTFGKKILNFFDRLSYQKADLVITHSISTKKAIVKAFDLKPEKVKAFYSRLDLKRFSPGEKYKKFVLEFKQKYGMQNKDILLYHGRFHKWHGLKYFFKVVPDLIRKNPRFVFIILGTEKKRIGEVFPVKIVNNPHFYFLPPVQYKKLPYYLALADLWFGRFAKEETSIPAFTTAGIEAMACGKPIIVSPSVEYRRFIQDGVNGIIVPFNNSQAIFEKVSFYFKNKKNKKRLIRMGKEARKTAEKYFSRQALVEFFKVWLKVERGKPLDLWGKRIERQPGYSQSNLREKRVDRRLSNSVKQGDKILDVGCFYPREAMHFAKMGCLVTAVDLSPKVIAVAKRTVAQKRFKGKIKFSVQDATRLKFKDNSFDVVCDFATSVHIPHWKKAIKEYVRVLRENGRLIIVANNKLQPIAWGELTKQWLNKGIHPRWGYFVPFFPWQLKGELKKNGLIIKKFDSEVMWKPVLPKGVDKFLDKLLGKLAKRVGFLKNLGWRYGFVAIKRSPS